MFLIKQITARARFQLMHDSEHEYDELLHGIESETISVVATLLLLLLDSGPARVLKTYFSMVYRESLRVFEPWVQAS